MLNQEQIESVWTRKIEAETRSYYFADLASRYTWRKQIITGSTFFLSSGAAATLIAKMPDLVPLLLSTAVALLAAYAMALGLDRRIQIMAKLHFSWNQVGTDYDRLWNHVFEDNAEEVFEDLLRRERDLSELAATEAPNNQKLMGEWEDHVLARYQLIKT